MRNIRNYLLLLCLAAYWPAHGQNLHLTYYSESNGLLSNQVRDVARDTFGFFWIATDAGLLRFDGLEFTNYTQEIPSKYGHSFSTVPEGLLLTHDAGVSLIRPGLDTSRISQFLEGSINPEDDALYYPGRVFARNNGELWFSQPGGRIARWKDGILKDVEPVTGTRTDKEPETTAFFVEPKGGQLWIALSDGGLYRFDDTTETLKKVQSPGKINDIQSTGQEIWIAGDYLQRLSLSEEGNEILKTEKYDSPVGEVTALSLDSKGNIYVGIRGKGLYYLDQREGTDPRYVKVFGNNNPHSVNELPFRNIHRIVQESDDRLWVCSEEGLGILQRRFFESLGSLPNANTASICIAENGKIFASFGDIYSIEQTDLGYEGSLLQGFSLGSVTSLAAADNRLWAGTSTGRLFQLNQQGARLGSVDLRPRGEGIFFMNYDTDGRLWICQAPEEVPLTGIGCLLPNGTMKEYGLDKGLTSLILCLQETEKGRIYCGGSGPDNYLFRYLPEEDAFINLSIPLEFNPGVSFAVHDLSMDKSGAIWLASTHGLLRFDMEHITRVDLDPLDSDTEIRAVCAMEDGSVWVSTETEGLLRVSESSSIYIREESGLPSEVMTYRGLESEPGGRLWVGSSEGIVHSLERNPKPRVSNPPRLISANIAEDTVSRERLNLHKGEELKLKFIAPSYHGFRTYYQHSINGGEWSDPRISGELLFGETEPGKYQLSIRSKKEGGYLWSEAINLQLDVNEYWYQNQLFWSAVVILLVLTFMLYLFSRRKRYSLNISELSRGLQEEKIEIEKKTADLEEAKGHILMEQRLVRAQSLSMEIMHRLISKVSPGMKWDVVLEIISIDLLNFPGVVAFEIGSRKGDHIEFEGYSDKVRNFTNARVEYKPRENFSSYTLDLAEPMIYNDLNGDAERLSLKREKRLSHFKSAIIVPFYLEKNPAVLSLYAMEADHFTKHGLQAMDVFATYLEQIY